MYRAPKMSIEASKFPGDARTYSCDIVPDSEFREQNRERQISDLCRFRVASDAIFVGMMS